MANSTKYWDSPVPYFTSKKEIYLGILGTVLFLVSFLLFFQPFGVNNYNPTERLNRELLLGVGSFAVVASAVLLINELIIRPALFPQMTRKTTVVWIAWTVLFLATCIYIDYNFLGNWHDWSLASYLEFQRNIAALMCMPVVLIGSYLYQKGLHQKLANITVTNNTSSQPASGTVIIDSDTSDRLILRIDQILFLESQDNYVAIHILEEHSEKKFLIRATLKRLQHEFDTTDLVRCHRKFIVNLSRVIQTSGNTHGMQLRIAHTDARIPVSRSYVHDVRNRLELIHQDIHPK